MKKNVDTRTLKNLNFPTRISIPDCKRLHLWVRSDLKKYWVFRFTYAGKRHDISLGGFPELTLSEAKSKATVLNGTLARGESPLQKKKNESETTTKQSINFSKFASDYIQTMSPGWKNLKHWETWISTINNYANPVIGVLPINEVTTDHIVTILTPIWTTKPETASRLRSRLEKILSAAITSGQRNNPNPALWKSHLENLLPIVRRVKNHHNAMPYADVPNFMYLLSHNTSMSSLALQFTILTASRTSEVLKAKRSEVIGAVWIIPAERMKMGREHQVPLCIRALKIIEMAKSLYPDSEYIFSNKHRHLSTMSMLMLLRGIRGELTVHGFRSSFRDWVSEETEHSGEVAEMALSHAVHNKIEAAYRRGKLLEKRRILMQDWENFCFREKDSR
jgi:integrase